MSIFIIITLCVLKHYSLAGKMMIKIRTFFRRHLGSFLYKNRKQGSKRKW